jgi:hypothetical protein
LRAFPTGQPARSASGPLFQDGAGRGKWPEIVKTLKNR